MVDQNQRTPVGSQGAPLQQDETTLALLVISADELNCVDIIDRFTRHLGIVCGESGEPLQQCIDTYDLLVQLRSNGVEIDPRDIRALISTDVIGVVDTEDNRQPAMDTVSRAGYFYLTDGTIVAKIGLEGAQIMISLMDHMTHMGHAYACDDYASGLKADENKYWLFKTPDTDTRIHLTVSVSASNGESILYEAPTTTDNGSTLTPSNKNRNSSNTSSLSVWKNPTVSSTGIQIGIIPLNNPKHRLWILKQNTTYLIKFTATKKKTTVNLVLDSYES